MKPKRIKNINSKNGLQFMIDKDWLEKVTLAYKVYSKEVSPNLSVEQFIQWMYKQYGIVQNSD